jgi:hypothetical protein
MGKDKKKEREEFFNDEPMGDLQGSKPVIPMHGKKSFAAAFEEYGRTLRKGKGANWRQHKAKNL